MHSGTDWATSSGKTWASRWRDTDRALSGVERALLPAILAALPSGRFRAFEIGCGAGATTADLAEARQDGAIVACDVSPALIEVARNRLSGHQNVSFVVGDAQLAASAEGPFDLLYSRHGVMFFDDPPAAFAKLRAAVAPTGQLVFSCFRSWQENPWASDMAAAIAQQPLPGPGREPGAFAFADPGYVTEMLSAAGWANVRGDPHDFTYVAGQGAKAVDQAQSFFSDIGPVSAALRASDEAERPAALQRVREALATREVAGRVEFPAAAWIWSASAA